MSASDSISPEQAVLLTTMRNNAVPSVARVLAGRQLAAIGNPRPEAMTVDGMHFCWVSAGEFFMGQRNLRKNGVVAYGGLIIPFPSFAIPQRPCRRAAHCGVAIGGLGCGVPVVLREAMRPHGWAIVGMAFAW